MNMVNVMNGRIEKLYRNEKVLLEYDYEDNAYLLYILDSKLRRRLKASMLFSYDGKRFIKSNGGRSIHIDKLTGILGHNIIRGD